MACYLYQQISEITGLEMAKIKKMKTDHYDWDDLVKAVEKKSGKDIRDWAGRNKNAPTADDYKTGNFPCAKWAVEQGYDWTVLNDPVDPEEMKLRIKINTEWRESGLDEREKIPHQDFWHYAESNIFYDVGNGSLHYFNPGEALNDVDDFDDHDESQEWVREILHKFIEVMQINKMKDEVEVWISW